MYAKEWFKKVKDALTWHAYAAITFATCVVKPYLRLAFINASFQANWTVYKRSDGKLNIKKCFTSQIFCRFIAVSTAYNFQAKLQVL